VTSTPAEHLGKALPLAKFSDEQPTEPSRDTLHQVAPFDLPVSGASTNSIYGSKHPDTLTGTSGK